MFLKFFLQITKINFSYTNFTWIVNKHLFWIFSRFVFGTTVKVVAVTAHLFTIFRCSITDKSVIAIPLFSVVTLFWFFFSYFFALPICNGHFIAAEMIRLHHKYVQNISFLRKSSSICLFFPSNAFRSSITVLCVAR